MKKKYNPYLFNKEDIKKSILLSLVFLLIVILVNIDARAAGYCKDNIPGVCASSPFCVNKKIGAACRSGGTCTALGKKKVGDCCSCKGGRSPNSSYIPRKGVFGNPQMLDEFREQNYRQGKPQYKYRYPSNNSPYWKRGYPNTEVQD